ncbi:MAG: hypothetical protein Q9186_005779 [Xanthomendoza sp. 1 TL-2023]
MAAQEPHDEGNILLLDKSTQPLALKIREACKILGIHDSALAGSLHEQQRITRTGPCEEWTLRWLLKKFERSEGCLDIELWSLFRELLPRVPLANLARLLRDHGFLDILLTTLEFFEESVIGAEKKGDKDPKCYTSGKSPSATNPTSATLRTSVVPPRPSKKRKLDKSMIKCDSSLPEKDPDLSSFRLVCSILRQMQALGRNNSHGYSVEHLRMALRASPEQAAELLGRSLNITKYTLQNFNHASGKLSNELFNDLMDPWVEIWKLRSLRAGDASIEMVFAARCLIPALEVLTALNELKPSNEGLDISSHTLEALLLQHVILPAKDSFEGSKKAHSALENGNKSIDINKLLAPLREHDFTSMSHALSWLKYPHSDHPIARFYGIIMEHAPLTTSKQRIANRPWLQFMFEYLSEQNPMLSTASSQDSVLSQGSFLATKQMLKAIADSGTKLGTATLERVLMQISQILDDTSNQVNWDIVGLCLKVDPDVFVVPDVPNLAGHPVTRKPNKFLTALLARLSLVTASSQVTSDASMAEILQNVLVPLVGGFAHARDLIGFVSHWKSNLVQSDEILIGPDTQPSSTQIDLESSSSIAEDACCIWEHERLLQAVADRVELHLTVGQIKTILQDANIALESNFRQLEEQTAAEALKILNRADPDNDANERLQCFNFLLSIIESADRPPYQDFAESTVQHVLNLLDLHAELLISQHSEYAIPPLGSTPESMKLILASRKSTLLYASLLCNHATALGYIQKRPLNIPG